jgi:hypothetical protein
MSAYLTDLPRVFREAAHHHELYGLVQGDYAPLPFTPASATCMAGSIHLACTGNPFETNELAAAAVRFASLHMAGEAPLTDGQPDYIDHIAAWNDQPERTVVDVVARLLRLALEAELEACAPSSSCSCATRRHELRSAVAA